jgi:hypothetical protein
MFFLVVTLNSLIVYSNYQNKSNLITAPHLPLYAKVPLTLVAGHQNPPDFLWVKVWVKVVKLINKLLNIKGYLELLCSPSSTTS